MTTRTRPYYSDGKITIYNCDCMEVLPLLPKIDLIATDPPYGMGFQSGMRAVARDKIRGDEDVDTAWLDFAVARLSSTGSMYVATRWDVYPEWHAAVAALVPVKNCIVWAKPGGGMGDLTGDYAPSHEFIIFAARNGHKLRGKRIGNVWTIPRDSNDAYLHPTQKPVAFFSRMIEKSSDPGMMVLDPFMGSGTSLVAAKRLGRCAIGCETERKYCDVAIKRLEQTGTSLLVDAPRKDRSCIL